MVKVSLIMATIGRTEEIRLFLNALNAQTYRNFELIIIDQNLDDRLTYILSEFVEKFTIIHIKNSVKGLSLNRNIGIKSASGDIFAFPDDDCIYNDPETLSSVVQFFEQTDYHFLSYNTIDFNTNLSVVNLLKYNNEIKWDNVFKTSISFTIFIKGVKKDLLFFDEKLGVGSVFGSGEESDLIFNLLYNGYNGYYNANRFIYHPSNVQKLTSFKGYNYGLGFGALFKKNIFYRFKYLDFFLFVMFLIKPIIRMILLKDFGFHWNTLKGRSLGFIKYIK